VKSVQVDNMLYNTPFPVVIFPKAPEDQQFLHIAINQAKGHKGVSFFNGLELVMQEADVRVDEVFATHMIALIEEALRSFAAPAKNIDWDTLAVGVPDFRQVAFQEDDMVYARHLFVGPIRLGLSFTLCPWAALKLKGELWNQVHDWLTWISDIEGVHLHLGVLSLENVFHSQEAFKSQIVQHYMHQALKAFFHLLGAVPVLGAPVELVTGLKTGLKEALSLPSHVIPHSPSDFGGGVRASSAALFRGLSKMWCFVLSKAKAGTIGTVFKEVGMATGTVSNVAAKLLDEESRVHREMVRFRQFFLLLSRMYFDSCLDIFPFFRSGPQATSIKRGGRTAIWAARVGVRPR
jgi:hypothetical protein